MDNRGEYKKAFREQALIERLRAQNAQLIETLQRLATYDIGMSAIAGEMSDIARKALIDSDARAAIIKATGQRYYQTTDR